MGTHCAEQTCHQLDFLPFNCDLCFKTFCKAHRSYKEHKCADAYKKDKLVPTCPLCGQALPVSKGMDADQRVNKHIEMECKSENKSKIRSNALCNFSSCRVRELVPVICESCHLHFCLNHRFPDQHDCQQAHSKARATKRFNSPFVVGTSSLDTKPATDSRCKIISAPIQSLRPKNKTHEDQLIADAIAASMKEPKMPGASPVSIKPNAANPRASASTTVKERKEQEDLDFAIALSLSEADNEKKRKAISVK